MEPTSNHLLSQSPVIEIRDKATGELKASILVDWTDYEWALQYNWHLSGSGRYAATNMRIDPKKNKGRRQKKIFMHVEIARRMGVDMKSTDVIDHVNQNKHDNRRENLRPATYRLNAINRTFSKPPGRRRVLPDPEPRNCAACGTTFTPRRKSPDAKYCSRDCQRRANLVRCAQ